jgi:predicted ABC-type sugar transport system permease subunit
VKTILLLSLLFGASLLSLSAALQAAPILVGNAGLVGQTLDADSVKAVLLGKKITLGGARVVIVLARAGERKTNSFSPTSA